MATSPAQAAWPCVEHYLEENIMAIQRCHKKAMLAIQRCLKKHMVSRWAQGAFVMPPELVSPSSDEEDYTAHTGTFRHVTGPAPTRRPAGFWSPAA